MPLPQLVEIEYDTCKTWDGHERWLLLNGSVLLPKSAVKVDADHKTVTMPRELAQGRGLI